MNHVRTSTGMDAFAIYHVKLHVLHVYLSVFVLLYYNTLDDCSTTKNPFVEHDTNMKGVPLLK